VQSGGRVRNANRRTAGLSWRILIYRMPTEPASRRVAVWRDLHRLGSVYLQQCVCILPAIEAPNAELNRITAKIPALGGDFTLLDVPKLPPDDEARIIAAFRAQRASEYAALIQECQTNFTKRVEFEHLQQNLSNEAVDDLKRLLQELERSLVRTKQHDWFAADGREDAERWLERCAQSLAQSLARAYRDAGRHEEALARYDELLGEDPLDRRAREGLLIAAAGTRDAVRLEQAWQQVCACLGSDDDPEARILYDKLRRELQGVGSIDGRSLGVVGGRKP